MALTARIPPPGAWGASMVRQAPPVSLFRIAPSSCAPLARSRACVRGKRLDAVRVTAIQASRPSQARSMAQALQQQQQLGQQLGLPLQPASPAWWLPAAYGAALLAAVFALPTAPALYSKTALAVAGGVLVCSSERRVARALGLPAGAALSAVAALCTALFARAAAMQHLQPCMGVILALAASAMALGAQVTLASVAASIERASSNTAFAGAGSSGSNSGSSGSGSAELASAPVVVATATAAAAAAAAAVDLAAAPVAAPVMAAATSTAAVESTATLGSSTMGQSQLASPPTPAVLPLPGAADVPVIPSDMSNTTAAVAAPVATAIAAGFVTTTATAATDSPVGGSTGSSSEGSEVEGDEEDESATICMSEDQLEHVVHDAVESALQENASSLRYDLQANFNTLLACTGAILYWRGVWTAWDQVLGFEWWSQALAVAMGLGIVLTLRALRLPMAERLQDDL